MKHEITLSINSGYIRASCSCGKFNGEAWQITLDDLNGAVHEHIEAAEAAVINRDAINDGRLNRSVNWRGSTVEAETVRVQGYRAESAITSEDQMLDIETGNFRT